MLRGRYRDTVKDPAGHPVVDTSWRSNTIVHGAWRLLAGLLKNDPSLDGILYWAVGPGEPAWDEARPPPDPGTAGLRAESGRARLTGGDIVYLDDDGRPTGEPRDRLEIRARFEWPDREVTLREFGLFGGHASEEAGSGFLINYVVHPRIDVTAGSALQRRLRLDFRPGRRERPPLPAHWLGSSEVAVIGGVGKAYTAALTEAGVATVEELARVEPLQLDHAVPLMKLVELRSKARLALRTAARLHPPTGLHAHPVWKVLVTPTATLAADTGAEEPEVARLRDDAAMLELALDHEVLRRLTIGELVDTE